MLATPENAHHYVLTRLVLAKVASVALQHPRLVMASVTVLCPGGRRCNIKVSPNTALLQVLEQACARQKLDASHYTLKRRGKALDLSVPFRYSNLTNCATLDLEKTETARSTGGEVVLALQRGDGSRVQGKFPTTTSLWDVAKQLGAVQEEEEEEESEPVMVYMSQQLTGAAVLKRTTLLDLGLSLGRAVIRLSFQPPSRAGQDLGPLSGKPATAASRQPTSSHADEVESMDTGKSGGDACQSTGGSVVPSDSVEIDVSETLDTGTDVGEQHSSSSSDLKAAQAPVLTVPEPDHAEDVGQEMATTDQPALTGDKDASREEKMDTDVAVKRKSRQPDAPIYFPSSPFAGSIFPDDVEPEPPSFLGPGPVPESASASCSVEVLPVELPGLDFQQLMQRAAIFAQMVSHTHGAPHTTQHPASPQALALADEDQPKPKPLPPSLLRQHSAKVYDEPCDREMVVFRLDDALPVTPSEELPEAFFNVTTEDVQKMHADLKRQTKQVSENPLMTKATKEALQERKLEHYSKAVVRVHFPDQWALQGCFRPRESLKSLVKFVRDNLADPQTKFHLYTTPPKEVLHNGRMTFAEAGFVPAAIVHVGTESAARPLLREQCLAQASSSLHAEVVQTREREESRSSSAVQQPQARATEKGVRSKPKAAKSGPRTAAGSSTSETGAKVPKWFKTGK